ncbi:MAG: phosphate ABC transporter permease PstA [Lachnospiraceae bacterium]|nr:phosphate ABC transporter permease PstA [Lachnospiraceae bacterium]
MNDKISNKRKAMDLLRKSLMYFSVGCTCALLLLVIGYVLVKGIPGLSISFLTTKPSYLTGNIGILPDILNTVYILVVAILLLLPLGVGAAIYLSEYAKNVNLVKLIDYAAETLSGIPSIIYGLAGMLFFCQTLGLKTSLLAGALTLVVMNLPTIMRTTRESLISVPKGLKEGAYGLGASKWRVVRTIIIPQCLDGIITGCILSAGRMLGESAALLFTAGFAHSAALLFTAGFAHALNGFFTGIKSSGATLTVALYVYAKEQGEFQVAFAIAVILLVLAMIVNFCAAAVKRSSDKKRKVS